jgi:hypothetical protein
VGQWVQYRVVAESQNGAKDDYITTVLIGGEEVFWGDEGFWLETWTEPKNDRPNYIASLMSYSIFRDSEAHKHVQEYARKLVTEMDLEGRPIQQVRRTSSNAVRSRPAPEGITWQRDTLGTDTVMVPRGTFVCQKVRLRRGVRATVDVGDSTVLNETEEQRTMYKTLDIPITSIVKEDIEKWIRRKAWRAGESESALLLTLEHSKGAARLIDHGEDLTPLMVPEQFRKSIRKTPARSATPASKKKPTSRKSG